MCFFDTPPQVQELLKNLFEGKELSRSINPDEAVAHGAAIQGDIVAGGTMDQPMIVLDVVALSQVSERAVVSSKPSTDRTGYDLPQIV